VRFGVSGCPTLAARVANESTGFPESQKGTKVPARYSFRRSPEKPLVYWRRAGQWLEVGNGAIIASFHLDTVTVGHLRAAPLRLRQNLPSGRVASGAAAYRLRLRRVPPEDTPRAV
jgi:hypothetical protein